ncbi:MAG TPA: hypothetical protein VJM53_09445, partial [Burkholderiales bacterium]|nr:hypothetical protein [Burkholderiales bacterium]
MLAHPLHGASPVLSVLKRIWPGSANPDTDDRHRVDSEAPQEIALGGHSFAFAAHIRDHHGFPIVDWEPVYTWVDGLNESERSEA